MSPSMRRGDMKKRLIRVLLAAAAGSALMTGLAAPVAADESCALIVVCADAPPIDTGPPADSAPPQDQTEQPPAPAAPQHRSSVEVTGDLLVMLNHERA